MNPRVESIQAALEEAQLTLDELAALCGVQPGWVIERVEQGLIEVCGADFAAWRFDAATLRRARAMRGIARRIANVAAAKLPSTSPISEADRPTRVPYTGIMNV
ncbi:MAG: chaperone modulator CbpM [Burkholderiaceae bacterium]|nr:chaperone modulator CbpM [Burkholderiaceae bacterium]